LDNSEVLEHDDTMQYSGDDEIQANPDVSIPHIYSRRVRLVKPRDMYSP